MLLPSCLLPGRRDGTPVLKLCKRHRFNFENERKWKFLLVLTVVVDKFLDEVDVREYHPAAAIPVQAEGV